MKRLQARGAKLGAVIVAAAVLWPSAAGASGDPLLPESARAGEDPTLQQRAAELYADQYGVSRAEAWRRLEIQDHASHLDEVLETALGNRYGGLWFDNQAGRLKVGIVTEAGAVTDSAHARAEDALRPRALLASSDLSVVRWAIEDLEVAQRKIDSGLQEVLARGHLRTAIDPSRNAVVAEIAGSVTKDESRAIHEAVDNAEGRAIVQASEERSLKVELAAGPCLFNNAVFCDPGFRGGTQVYNGGGTCTAGFMARMNPPDYTFRMLTAGHCVTPSDTLWYSRNGSNVQGDIGYRHSWSYGYGGDAGTVKVEHGRYFYDGGPAYGNQAYPLPRVIVDSSADTTADHMYYIGAEASSYVGLYVCVTSGVVLSSGDYTTCGTVNALNQSIVPINGNGITVNGTTRACLHTPLVPGASGGPWYKNNNAYGISSARDVNGGCSAWYVEATTAEQQMNVFIMH